MIQFVDRVTDFLFGVSQDSLLAGTKDDSTGDFISIFDKSLIGLHTRMFLGRLVFIRGGDNQLRKDISYVHAFVDRYVEMAIDRQRLSEKTVEKSRQPTMCIWMSSAKKQRIERNFGIKC